MSRVDVQAIPLPHHRQGTDGDAAEAADTKEEQIARGKGSDVQGSDMALVKPIAKYFVVLAVLLLSTISSSAQTAKRVAVIVVAFPESPAPRLETMQWAADTMARVDAYYAEQSYGAFTPDSDVFGVFTIAAGQTATRSEIATLARQAAVDAGVDLAPYTDFVYISPQTQYVYAGWGDLQGVWIAVDYPAVGIPTFHVLAHELGHHFFGLNHAGAYRCSNGSPVDTEGGACTVWEYGDSLDVMGHGDNHFSGPIKARLGWTAARTITSSGDYFIEPLAATPRGGDKVLLLNGGKGRQSFTYALEYRQPIGFDANLSASYADPANVYNGVIVHLMQAQPQLLFMDPTIDPQMQVSRYPALTAGRKLCDAKFNATVLSTNVNGALVRIRFGGKC
jgi:hypothetical protein